MLAFVNRECGDNLNVFFAAGGREILLIYSMLCCHVFVAFLCIVYLYWANKCDVISVYSTESELKQGELRLNFEFCC